jgi:hypothetical protein
MPRSRRQLRRASRMQLFIALGAGLGQGIAVVTGYVTGMEDRILAVSVLIVVTSVITVVPGVITSKKNQLVAQ